MQLRKVLMTLALSILSITAFIDVGLARGGGGGHVGGGSHGGGGGHGGGGHYPAPHPAPNPNRMCVAQDAAGIQYTGYGYNQNQAANNAMNACYSNNPQTNTCQLVYCR